MRIVCQVLLLQHSDLDALLCDDAEHKYSFGETMSQSIKNRMIRSIALRRGNIILRDDFKRIGSPSQISRVLKDLVDEGRIVRLGYGVYAKAKPSVLSGKPVPCAPLEELAQEALTKLGVSVEQGKSQRRYASGQTTQIPMQATFNTKDRRISRKLSVGGRSIRYENDYTERA